MDHGSGDVVIACSVKGCEKPIKSKGMCQMHYFRMWRHGTLVPKVEHRPGGRGICTVTGCGKPDSGHHGLCGKHFSRLKRNGGPEILRGGPKIYKGPEHVSWQGDNVQYGGIHCRLRSHRGLASSHACVDCGKPAQQWAYDHKDPNELIQQDGKCQGLPYSTNLEHYEPKCISCHRLSDLKFLGKSIR